MAGPCLLHQEMVQRRVAPRKGVIFDNSPDVGLWLVRLDPSRQTLAARCGTPVGTTELRFSKQNAVGADLGCIWKIGWHKQQASLGMENKNKEKYAFYMFITLQECLAACVPLRIAFVRLAHMSGALSDAARPRANVATRSPFSPAPLLPRNASQPSRPLSRGLFAATSALSSPWSTCSSPTPMARFIPRWT